MGVNINVPKSRGKTLTGLSRVKSVLITTVPKRYDSVTLLNNYYIRELVVWIESVYLIDLDYQQRFHTSKQGLHINKKEN